MTEFLAGCICSIWYQLPVSLLDLHNGAPRSAHTRPHYGHRFWTGNSVRALQNYSKACDEENQTKLTTDQNLSVFGPGQQTDKVQTLLCSRHPC
ncbi:hypothetical protein RRG08_008377 [Elysia crispata]|uniref:Uncharacterized protein n=1 Tax=Elysia crispata TaxID=231223 RepID=A0AAE1AZ83_9GAST|nr:hypothetical protein RRG08_008377 [Elysia crispata]